MSIIITAYWCRCYVKGTSTYVLHNQISFFVHHVTLRFFKLQKMVVLLYHKKNFYILTTWLMVSDAIFFYQLIHIYLSFFFQSLFSLEILARSFSYLNDNIYGITINANMDIRIENHSPGFAMIYFTDGRVSVYYLLE